MAQLGNTSIPGVIYVKDKWGELTLLITVPSAVEYIRAKIPNAKKFTDDELVEMLQQQFAKNKTYYLINKNSLYNIGTFESIINIAVKYSTPLAPIIYTNNSGGNSGNNSGGNSGNNSGGNSGNNSGGDSGGNSGGGSNNGGNSGGNSGGGQVITPTLSTSDNNTMLYVIGGAILVGAVILIMKK